MKQTDKKSNQFTQQIFLDTKIHDHRHYKNILNLHFHKTFLQTPYGSFIYPTSRFDREVEAAPQTRKESLRLVRLSLDTPNPEDFPDDDDDGETIKLLLEPMFSLLFLSFPRESKNLLVTHNRGNR